jgi:hypothetical protein
VQKPLPITDVLTHRAVVALRQAVEGTTALDPRSRRLHAALDYLARAMPGAWGVAQFRTGLMFTNDTARWQNCNASLNAIERARAEGAGVL